VGLAKLVPRLQAIQPVRMVLEATGGLEVLVTSALAAAELPVVGAIHARLVKVTGQLVKTKALETRALAHLAEAVRPALRPLPDAQT
jgi:transposase